MVAVVLHPPPPLSETSTGMADVSMVGLQQNIRGQGRIFTTSIDFSATINAGARSALSNITGVAYNKICIVGIVVVSELNTNWRLKFYRKDTGIVTAYNNDTFIGDEQITGLSATASTYYEGSSETAIFYSDEDLTNEIHLIAENIGAVNSKLFVMILYTEAD